MLTKQKLINPGPRRIDVMLNSVACCVSNASEELPRAPEMPFPEMLSQPWMFSKKFKGCDSLKQLECSANTHGGKHFDEKVDVVDSYMQFVDAETVFFSNFPDESFTINPNTVEPHRIFGILRFPNKVKGILPEGMLKTSQVHFFTPPNYKFGKFNSKEKSTEFFISYGNELNNRTAIPRSASKA